MQIDKLVELIKSGKLDPVWECISCNAGPCYFIGEWPHNCACDGAEYTGGNKSTPPVTWMPVSLPDGDEVGRSICQHCMREITYPAESGPPDKCTNCRRPGWIAKK